MPILVASDGHQALTQGDVLKDLTLAFGADEGPSVARETDGLVISRPCVAVRRPFVQVAMVKPLSVNLTEILKGPRDAQGKSSRATLDQVRRRSSAIRDGDEAEHRDRFYLGSLPGSQQRVAAYLDRVFLVEVPTVDKLRATWTQKHRQARLAPSFQDDLRFRLFQAFSRQGFDDHQWYDDEDLELIITHGETILADERAGEYQAQCALGAAQGDGLAPKRVRSLQDAVASAEKRRAATEALLAPYREERERRRAMSTGPASAE